MSNWKVILATIVIFGAGVVTGGLLVNHVARFHPQRQPVTWESLPPALRAQLLNTNFVQLLNDRLRLSPKQREQIRKVIAKAQQNTHDLWKLVSPQFQLVWRDTRQQIRSVLTPVQRREFEFMIHERRPRRAPSAKVPPATPSAPTNSPSI